MIQDIVRLLQSHSWLCPYILAGCALITLLLKLKKKGKRKKSSDISMTIGDVKSGNINQANGNININDRNDHAE